MVLLHSGEWVVSVTHAWLELVWFVTFYSTLSLNISSVQEALLFFLVEVYLWLRSLNFDPFHTESVFRHFSAKNSACKAPENASQASPVWKPRMLAHWGGAIAGQEKKSCKRHLWGGSGAYTAYTIYTAPAHWNEKSFRSAATWELLTPS